MTLQIRRGTDSDRKVITPALGELIFTTDTKELFVGDGSTAGGNHVATDSNVVTSIVDSSFVQLKNKGFPYANLSGSPTIPTLGTSFIDSAEAIKLITANAIDSSVALTLLLDSIETINLIDSTYIQARQSFSDSGSITTVVDSAYVQLRTLDGDKSLNGLKALQFIHDSDAASYAVTVATKDASHRYQGTGSSLGYKIDGTFAPTIVMNPGNTYRFDMSDGTTGTHPLYFYYDAAKTTQYTTNVVNNYASKAAGQAGSYIEITVTDDTPSVLHYQCGSHNYMGGMINTQTRNLTGFTTDNLTEGSSNLYYTNTRVSTLVDSSYVQLRQSGGAITVQEEGSPLSTSATTLNFVGSAVTATGSGATKTITITQATGGTDSSTVIALIAANAIDSAATIDIITDELSTFSVGDIVGADGNPGDTLISDGDGTASFTPIGGRSLEFKVTYRASGGTSIIDSVQSLPAGFTLDSQGDNSLIISHNTGRSVKDVTFNRYVSGTLKLKRSDSADLVTNLVADRLNKFTLRAGIVTTGADSAEYAYVNMML